MRKKSRRSKVFSQNFIGLCQFNICSLWRFLLKGETEMSHLQPTPKDKDYMHLAFQEAQKSLADGGIPIGSVLVIDDKIVGRGHNRRIQESDPVLHGEMHCFKNAGRLKAKDYQRATLYTTLSPCDMCSGAILLYKIPRVVMAENKTFIGAEDLLKSRGVELVNLNMLEAIEMMESFIKENPDLWNEDIGI